MTLPGGLSDFLEGKHALTDRAYEKIARALRQHRELIRNYFRAQKLISSGEVEGLNNKAKVTMRKPFGFRTYRVLELALLLTWQAAGARVDPRFLTNHI